MQGTMKINLNLTLSDTLRLIGGHHDTGLVNLSREA